jgi:hypothetical protein
MSKLINTRAKNLNEFYSTYAAIKNQLKRMSLDEQIRFVERTEFVAIIEDNLPNYERRDDVACYLCTDLPKYIHNEFENHTEDQYLYIHAICGGNMETAKKIYVTESLSFYKEALRAKLCPVKLEEQHSATFSLS